MNWKLKVAAFKLLSSTPGGDAIYRFCQERLTKSVTLTSDRLQNKVDVARRYWSWLEANGETGNVIGGSHVDFGAGWHPTIPFYFYSRGVERQYLLDIEPRFDRKLIVDTIRIFRETAADRPWGRELQRMPNAAAPDDKSWESILEKLGIRYVAPYDHFGRDITGSIDMVTSSQVLLHIGDEGLRLCFRFIHEVMKPGGLFLAVIHLRDLYADSDSRISDYNHLRYSPLVWEKVINSSLMPFNRLKAPDYRRILEETGFSIRHFEVDRPTAADFRELERVPIHDCFSRYSQEELAAKHLFFVAAKS